LNISGAYEVQHHATAVSLVAAGIGCAVLPASCIETGDRRQLVSVPLGRPVVKRKILLIQRKGAELSEPAARFAEILLNRE
jgi:DNA-binding transcriptional LysR family regulator